jgi:hypothetical protein
MLGEMDVIKSVLLNTNNDVMIFIVIMIVAVGFYILPIYGMILKGRKQEEERKEKDREYSMEQQQILLSVITKNSSVISDNSQAVVSLKEILKDMKNDNKNSFSRIHNRIDENTKSIVLIQEICSDIKDRMKY